MRISDWSSDVCSSDLASAFANAVGAALGGLLLELDGLAGLRGWQWVFIVTAIPALLLVPVVLSRLPRGPAEARWLSDDQKAWLAQTLAAAGGPREHGNGPEVRRVGKECCSPCRTRWAPDK